VEALEKGPDGKTDAESAALMLLLTPCTVPAWYEGDGYEEVGDGTGKDPLADLEYPRSRSETTRPTRRSSTPRWGACSQRATPGVACASFYGCRSCLSRRTSSMASSVC